MGERGKMRIAAIGLPVVAAIFSTGCAGLAAVLDDLDLGEMAAVMTEDVRLQGEVISSTEDVPAFHGEPGIVNEPDVLQCGQQLACVEGWDLRVLGTEIPADRMPAGDNILAQTQIQNRGQEPSTAVEVRMCAIRTHDSRANSCVGRFELVTLPPLNPGETATLRKPVEVPTSEGSYRVGVRIDPDGISGRMSGNNGVGVSDAFRSELPGLQWLNADAGGPYRRAGPVTINFEVRNESFVMATDSIVVQPWTHIAGSLAHLRNSQYRFVIPALGPRETYRGSVTMRNAIRSTPNYNTSAYIDLNVDPDGEQSWTSRSGVHQRSVRTNVRVHPL